MNVTLLGDRILIEKVVKKNPSGLIVPENQRYNEGQEGIVKKVGIRRDDNGDIIKSLLKEKDRVMFINREDIIELEGKKFNLVKEEDILGVFE